VVCKSLLRLLIGFSQFESESSAQLTAGAREMPSDRDGIDAKQGCDCCHGLPLEFVHDEDGSPTRGQVVERPPDRCPDHKRLFWIGLLDCGMAHVDREIGADRFLTPCVSSDVDKHPNQPRLFVRQSARNGFG
jgi:hypothetical protein